MIRFKCLPLNDWITTSKFGKRDYKDNPWHNGIDGRAAIGTPVYAVADGVVKVAKDNPTGYGNYIVLDHRKWGSLYGHLSSFNIRVGQNIDAGQIIGYSGNTGMSTGPHLHFELRFCEYKDFWDRKGDIFLRCIDPLPFIEKFKKTNNLTVEKAIEIVQAVTEFEDKTIDYLVNDYRWGHDLIIKLAKAI